MRRTLGAVVVGTALLTATPVAAADRVRSVEDAYASRALRRTPFDARVSERLDREDARFLEELFALTDEAVLLNTNVGHWFFTRGSAGLHADAYLDRIDSLRLQLEELRAPSRAIAIRDLVAESLGLQRAFVAEWYDALEDGRAFESQLTDEYAYHEGIHVSQKKLLQAFAELRALFPNAGTQTHRAFHDHLRAAALQ